MQKEKSPFTELLSWTAVAGNILFVLWILYNGINESFQGTTIEKISSILTHGTFSSKRISTRSQGKKIK